VDALPVVDLPVVDLPVVEGTAGGEGAGVFPVDAIPKAGPDFSAERE